jgi:Asp-tRNA(Asn)/Glu-tRNA(Gln) amidotransferase B subunit
VDEVIAANAKGKANPGELNRLLKRKLAAPGG